MKNCLPNVRNPRGLTWYGPITMLDQTAQFVFRGKHVFAFSINMKGPETCVCVSVCSAHGDLSGNTGLGSVRQTVQTGDGVEGAVAEMTGFSKTFEAETVDTSRNKSFVSQ